MRKKIETFGKVSDSITFGSIPEADKSFVVDALNKGASRRQVMGWLMAMGATVATAGSIVTSATEAIAATPKKGGSIRFAWDLHGPDDTLDPNLFAHNLDYCRGRFVYNNLCRLQEDLTVKPELAESFEANAAATEWTFELRKDVMFHDGSKMTADDVVYSMMRHLGKESTSKAKVLVGDIKEWKKDGEHTVKAILENPNAELPIALGTFHFKILKAGTTDFQTANGTGPFKLAEFKPGVRTKFLRNDDYWGSEGPYVDEAEIFGITDSVARVNALISGDVHMAGNVDPKSIGQVEAADNVEIFSVPSGSYMNWVARYDKSPAGANHLDFITGLKHLQRRDRILKVIQKGVGDIGNDQPVGPAYGASWCKEANDPPMFGYDPDKAKFHLKKAGITSAQIDVAEVGPGLTDICLLLQRECKKVGFDLNVKKVPNDGYWGAIWNKTPMHVSSWNMRPSANVMMTLAYKSDAPWNESAWGDERFDQLLTLSRGELDPAKRYEMNCEMQKICAAKCGTGIATHRAYIDGKAKTVKGLPRVPLAAFGGQEWPEFVWLES